MAQNTKTSKAKSGAAKSATGTSSVLWTVRVELVCTALCGRFKEILRGLRSPDRPTRRMSAVFVASLIGLLLVSGYGVHRYRRIQHMKAGVGPGEEAANNLGEFLKKQAEEARHKASLISIGTFTVELRAMAGQKSVPGVVNMAEVEISLECDSKQTRELIEGSQEKVRSAVTNALTALDRTELMSREGKKRLKKSIIDRINLILPQGKVEDLYFTKLTMT